MKKLNFDTGLEEYRVNGGEVLRFNPRDPNLYARFLQAQDKILAIENELVEGGGALPQGDEEERGRRALALTAQADRKVKEVLNWVFGPENDFDALLGGVNLLAVTSTGERVVTNLFAALTPVIEEGARLCAGEKAAQAKARREHGAAGR